MDALTHTGFCVIQTAITVFLMVAQIGALEAPWPLELGLDR